MVTKYTEQGIPYGEPPYTEEEEFALYASCKTVIEVGLCALVRNRSPRKNCRKH